MDYFHTCDTLPRLGLLHHSGALSLCGFLCGIDTLIVDLTDGLRFIGLLFTVDSF